MKNFSAGRIARDVPMIVSLALTLAVGGQGVAADLPLDGKTAFALGMGGALLFDSLWLAGSAALPDALVVKGGKLALSVSAMVAGIAASIWSLAHYGHGPLFLAPVFAVLLTVGIELNKHVTPSAETIEELRIAASIERDQRAASRAALRLSRAQRSRASVDREIVAQKLTDELLDAHRAEAARTMALLAAQSKLAGALDKSESKNRAGAARFAELMGSKAAELAPAVPVVTVPEILPVKVAQAATEAQADDDGYDFVKGVLAEAENTVAADTTMNLLTYAQVAQQLGVAPGTVRSWKGRGKLVPADHTVDGSPLFHPNDVAKLG